MDKSKITPYKLYYAMGWKLPLVIILQFVVISIILIIVEIIGLIPFVGSTTISITALILTIIGRILTALVFIKLAKYGLVNTTKHVQQHILYMFIPGMPFANWLYLDKTYKKLTKK
jgi:nucleoside recognition membrane protein YjiH